MIIYNSKVREIEVDGFKVEVHRFNNRSYYYPSFNGNAEFRVSSEGFRQLRHYLRTVKRLCLGKMFDLHNVGILK